MSKNSVNGYFEDLESTAWVSYEEDQPISAYSTLALRDGLQHALDQSGQYRINWCAVSGDPKPGVSDPSGSVETYRYPFPITSIRKDRPMQLDVRVAVIMESGGQELDLDASIYPRGQPGQVLWSASANTTTTTAHWAIDELATWTREKRHRLGRFAATSVDNDASSVPSTAYLDMLELELVLTGTTFAGSGTISVCGVQVREYP